MILDRPILKRLYYMKMKKLNNNNNNNDKKKQKQKTNKQTNIQTNKTKQKQKRAIVLKMYMKVYFCPIRYSTQLDFQYTYCFQISITDVAN